MAGRPCSASARSAEAWGQGGGVGGRSRALSGGGVLVRVVSTSGSPPGWGRPGRIGGPAARPLTGRGPHPRTIAPAQPDAPKGDHSTLGRNGAGPGEHPVGHRARNRRPAGRSARTRRVRGGRQVPAAGESRAGRAGRAGGPAAAPWIRCTRPPVPVADHNRVVSVRPGDARGGHDRCHDRCCFRDRDRPGGDRSRRGAGTRPGPGPAGRGRLVDHRPDRR